MKAKLLFCLFVISSLTSAVAQTCTAFPVPFHEGFNSDSTSESCWTVINSNGDTDSWDMNYATNPFEGNQVAMLNTDFNAGNNNDWLISPQIILNGNERLKFRYRVQTTTEPNDFRVMISTTGSDPNDFTNILLPLATYNNSTYIEAIINLSTFTGPVNIAWHVPAGGLDGWRLYIDDVNVETIPSCSEPFLLTVSNQTDTSATLSWLNSDGNSYQILALPCGSPAPNANTTGYITSTTNPTVVTGLTQNTCYDFYIRANCGVNDLSVWSNRVSSSTLLTPPVCGGQFYDNGGANGNYLNNSDTTTIICPSNSGEIVTVTFSSFNTEASFDGLYVFDGNSINAPQIASTNPAGSLPGGLSGAFWGTTIPGPFTSSSPDGCLTFRFRSDSSATREGWVADVTCSPPPTCLKPTTLIDSNTTTTSINLSWTDNNTTNPAQWEVLILPCNSSVPSISAQGIIANTNNSFLINNLQPSTCYTAYVRALCSSSDKSAWSVGKTFYTSIVNDDCINAITVPVNNVSSCSLITNGSLIGATPSAFQLSATCFGIADDDVWFRFVATNSAQAISLQNIAGTTTNLNHAVYSGDCTNLNLLYCSGTNQNSSQSNNFTIGNTYYLRIYSNANTPQSVTFNLCISIPSTCATAISVCGVNAYTNTTGGTSLGTIGCLTTTPNASFLKVKIAQTGPVNLLITQSTLSNGSPNIDVDYAAWGPFTSQNEACDFIGTSQPYAAPGIGVPISQQYGCSYSTAATENLLLTNAQAGEYYILLVTNFSNQPGFITIAQSNINDVGAGSIDCVGIRLNAFVDNNNNGVQDANDPNFPLGQFHYEINNDTTIHNIMSPTGIYTIFDSNLANSYDLNYSINNDYTSMYSVNTSYSNVNVATGSLTTYNFPITKNQDYTDLAVTLTPINAPRAGTTYQIKITYTNNGTQTIASGSFQFTKDNLLTITNIALFGGVATANGFSYDFTNLLPFESRSITVVMQVPAIPTVSIGQLLTNSVQVTPPTGDVVLNNNTASLTQAIIAAYDPNDKTESHGEQIVFSTFSQDDYLHYTIRFENTGNIMALDVYLEDILDAQLDESSIIMESASHGYTLDRTNRNLYWTFRNIYLPVSIPNTDIGKGYVTFKAKLKPGFAIGDIIPNTANIYFDSNPAIVTNTFNTEFVQFLGSTTFTDSNISVYPNPASSYVDIELNNSSEQISAVTLFDMLGKRILDQTQISGNQTRLNTASLQQGIYLIEIKSTTNMKLVKKLVIR